MHKVVSRKKTAIRRHNYSRPISCAIDDGLIVRERSVFDYGCGHGDDIARLRKAGFDSSGWDPSHKRSTEPRPADIVNLGYVVNVIEDLGERRQTLRRAWDLARELLIVSAQLTIDAKIKNAVPYNDGYLTKRGTFQKYFEQRELKEWISDVLDEAAVPAAPGIFYVFRDEVEKEAFVSSRYRRRTAVPRLRKADELFEAHKDLLQPLMDFYADRGRLASESELADSERLIDAFGSIRKAFRVIQIATETEQWERISEDRSQDLLVYLALSRFDGRKKFSELPSALQLDVKALFSNYKRACSLSDVMLYGCGDQEMIDKACVESMVGKLTPNALYVHESAVGDLAPILRVYEGCANSYVGSVDGANLIKLHRRKPKISYLSYPDFEKDPHPALQRSFTVNLQTFRIRQMYYSPDSNPPILHRKELFVSADHELRSTFERLTRSEEKAGLYAQTSTIGRRDEWDALLESKGLYLRGHRLLRVKK